jgi:hypothetical protein
MPQAPEEKNTPSAGLRPAMAAVAPAIQPKNRSRRIGLKPIDESRLVHSVRRAVASSKAQSRVSCMSTILIEIVAAITRQCR